MENAENSAEPAGFLNLFTAIKKKKIDEIRALIRRLGGYVNNRRRDADGPTPLHEAVKLGDEKILKIFLSVSNVDVNVKDNHGYSPLHEAARIGKIEIMKLLLSAKNIDVNVSTDCRFTALHVATQTGNVEILKLLLKARNVDLKAEDNEGLTALHLAAQVGNVEVLKLLADAQNPNVNVSALKCILEKENLNAGGADDNAQNKAATANDKVAAFFESLLTADADINPRGKTNYKTLMQIAALECEDDSRLAMIKVLLDNGANVNVQDKHGKTPLHHLVSRSNFKTVELLLNFQCGVNVKNKNGEIPLFGAVECCDFKVVQLLLEHGSDVNVFNVRGSAPLHLAAQQYKNSYNIVKCLMESGADADALDAKGQSPLLIILKKLCRSGSFKIPATFLFVLRYSDFNVIDNEGNNVFIFNMKHEHSKVILEHIAKFQALGVTINPSVESSILSRADYSDYFTKCTEELAAAKNEKLRNCWVTLFNILTDNKRKLKNYAGNAGLITEFKKSGCVKKYPIYGPSMQKNMEKGINRRKLFDKSAGILSNSWPIFGPSHLIIRDLLDCLKTKDLSKFCE